MARTLGPCSTRSTSPRSCDAASMARSPDRATALHARLPAGQSVAWFGPQLAGLGEVVPPRPRGRVAEQAARLRDRGPRGVFAIELADLDAVAVMAADHLLQRPVRAVVRRRDVHDLVARQVALGRQTQRIGEV